MGGNREKWGNDHNITAVEFDPAIAKVYADKYPNDTLIVGDAVDYLLKHYLEFDMIWASPPCQSHSRVKNSQYTRESYTAVLPDMMLWQIIAFLQLHGRKAKWVVENVIPYYTPLIEPTVKLDRHLYWTNFPLEEKAFKKEHIIKYVKSDELSEYKDIKNKRQVIRNKVNPTIGEYILEQCTQTYEKEIYENN